MKLAGISVMMAMILGICMWIVHFQINHWKSASRPNTSEGSWTQAREKRIMRELRSHVEILVTDHIIRLRGSIPSQDTRKQSVAGAGSVNRYESTSQILQRCFSINASVSASSLFTSIDSSAGTRFTVVLQRSLGGKL